MARGIADHFPIRVTEWAMIVPAFGMGVALWLQDDMFTTSPSFAKLAQWGDESMWCVLVLLCAVARLGALTINGSFQAFPYTPHLRAAASLIGITFWGQYSIGFLAAALYGGGAWSGVIAYSTFVILELVNLSRSTGDIRRVRGK
ncbi:hypothetical protein [Pelagovum pacificum]|nr:hypothetical protein [Pelagovum pacificum]